jgi:hypothetical protein
MHPLLVRSARDERRRRALKRSELFFPYFATRASYDDRRARVALLGSGIVTTPLSTYFDRLIEFALAPEWGRRQLPRASTTAAVPPPSSRGSHVARAQADLAVAR